MPMTRVAIAGLGAIGRVLARRLADGVPGLVLACAATGQNAVPLSFPKTSRMTVMQTKPTTMRRLAASRKGMPVMTPRPATVDKPQKSAQIKA